MSRKRKTVYLRSCKRCKKFFHGSKFASICDPCDKRADGRGGDAFKYNSGRSGRKTENQIRDIIRKRLENGNKLV